MYRTRTAPLTPFEFSSTSNPDGTLLVYGLPPEPYVSGRSSVRPKGTTPFPPRGAGYGVAPRTELRIVVGLPFLFASFSGPNSAPYCPKMAIEPPKQESPL